MEHDFYVGIGLAIVLTYLVKTQGPAFTAEYVIFYGCLSFVTVHPLSLNKQLDEEEAALRAIRQDEIDACLASVI